MTVAPRVRVLVVQNHYTTVAMTHYVALYSIPLLLVA